MKSRVVEQAGKTPLDYVKPTRKVLRAILDIHHDGQCSDAVEASEPAPQTEDHQELDCDLESSSSSSSDSGEWNREHPFGSRAQLLEVISAFKPGDIFSEE